MPASVSPSPSVKSEPSWNSAWVPQLLEERSASEFQQEGHVSTPDDGSSFNIVHTGWRAWLIILGLGVNGVSAERRKYESGCISHPYAAMTSHNHFGIQTKNLSRTFQP